MQGLQYANLYDRGFMLLTVSPQQVSSQWQYVDTIKQAEYQLLETRAKQAVVQYNADSATRLTLQ